MYKKLAILVALFAAVLLAVTSAQAGPLLIVSGDSNLGNSIDGSAGATIADNGRFFMNILGGGTKVVFRTTTNGDTATEITSQQAIINYYLGQGVAVTSGLSFSAADLVGADLLIGFLPDVAFSGAELLAMNSFLGGGGRVLLTGEWTSFDAVAIGNVNTALAYLNSGLRIDPQNYDLGFHMAAGAQIANDPLNAGVARFGYAATSGVTGGTPLFYTTGGAAFIAYEGGNVTVPDAGSSLLLLGIGLAGLRASRKRLG